MSFQPIFDLATPHPPIFAAWAELAVAAPHREWGRIAPVEYAPEALEFTRSDFGPNGAHYLVPGWSDPDHGPDPEHSGPAHPPDMWALVSLDREDHAATVQAVAQTASDAHRFFVYVATVLVEP